MGKIKKPSEAAVSQPEMVELKKQLAKFEIKPTVSLDVFAQLSKKINPKALVPFEKLPDEMKASIQSMNASTKRFHGAKVSLNWFPRPLWVTSCSDKFGYLTSNTVRQASKLDFNPITIGLMNRLGDLMADPGRDVNFDSNIPAGYTYFGQFVDHDITLDVSSSLDTSTDARTINNMRSPALDLDSIYGRGPALDPFLYDFPASGSGLPSTAIKLKMGQNSPAGPGGPSLSGDFGANMQQQFDFDVPRVNGSNTAIIGDPRNDENLFVSQFHMAMLKFHNAVVDLLVTAVFTGDLFVEAKKIVVHHYQWAVVQDFLKRICGTTAVDTALTSVTAPIGSTFRMPVEFSVAAYRFGHSLIRDAYWINHNFINQPLSDAFNFIRNPNLPVLSNWVVDFNAFFPTGVAVPVFNSARKIDSVLATGLESLPGGSGIMALLAARNLRRGLAFGMPSGQATATALGLTPMTTAELTRDLPTNEINLLNSAGGMLLNKTPLWYYLLREAAVLANGDTLGPVGAKIVADTFVKMLKRDADSYLNKSGGFTPFLNPSTPGDFTVTDIITFSGVNRPF